MLLTLSTMGNITGDVNVTVDENDVEEYNVDIIVDNAVFEEEEREGFEIFLHNSTRDEFNDRISTLDFENKNISTIKNENTTIFRLELDNVNAKESAIENDSVIPAVSHERYNNGTIIYRQSLRAMTRENDFRVMSNLNSAYGYDINLLYTVNTQHPITETNGDKISDRQVQWRFTPSNATSELYVKMDGPQRNIVDRVGGDGLSGVLLLIVFFLVSFSLMAFICYKVLFFMEEEF